MLAKWPTAFVGSLAQGGAHLVLLARRAEQQLARRPHELRQLRLGVLVVALGGHIGVLFVVHPSALGHAAE